MSDELLWYASIYGCLFFTGIGLPPVPEEAGILYAASLHALHPEVRWPFAWLATTLGIMSADMVLYGVGYKWGPRLFEYKWVQRFLKAERRKRLEGRFHDHGMKLLILARFLPPLRTGIFLIAGASRYSTVKFLIADAVYGIVGVGLFFLFGTWMVGWLDHIRHWVGHRWVFLLAVPVIGYALYRYYLYLRKRELKGAPEPPLSVVTGPEGKVPEGEAAKKPEKAPEAIADAKQLLKD